MLGALIATCESSARLHRQPVAVIVIHVVAAAFVNAIFHFIRRAVVVFACCCWFRILCFYGISLTSSSSSSPVVVVCTIARLTVHTKLTGRANGAEETLPSARTWQIAYTRKINNENRRWWRRRRRRRGGTDWLWDATNDWRSTHSQPSDFFLIEWNLCNINRM